MAINKKISNIVIGFDTRKCKARILSNQGNDFRKVLIEQFDCDKELIKESAVTDLLSNVLNVYLKGKMLQQPDVYIVLPDYFVTIDHITLPIMPENKMKDALKGELKKLYLNYNELEINSSIFAKSKKQVEFTISIIKKSIINECINVCKKYNLSLRNISYSSNGIINSFLALGNKVKHSSYIFANVEKEQTRLIYANKDKLINFAVIPFGLNVLSNDKEVFEGDYIKNNSSKFLMFNIESNMKNDSNAIDYNYENEYIKQFNYSKRVKRTALKLRDNYVSEICQSGNSILEKNFSIIAKYISSYKNEIKKGDFAVPEYAIINMPNEYKINLNNIDCDLKLQKFSESIMEDCYLNDYLDLYGMLYAVVYNKGQNFVDKEKQSLIGKINMQIYFALRSIKNFASKKLKRKKKGNEK